MPRPIRKEYAGAKYHVTSRGNGGAIIFLGNADYAKFTEQLELALRKDRIVLYAFVIMPNHYHLLLETPHGNLHAFIQRLNTAYSLYWRYKHQRPGHVFQGRYKAKLVAGDKYLLALTRYIHLNPVKGESWNSIPAAKRYQQLNEYRWSSYRAYIGRPNQTLFVNLRWLELMGGRSLAIRQARYRAYIKGMIINNDDELMLSMKASRYVVGDANFVMQTENELCAKRLGNIQEKDVFWPEENSTGLESIDNAVAQTYGIEKKLLKCHGNVAGEAKGIALELACTLGGLSQRAAGQYYGGISCAAVGLQRRQLHARMAHDSLLQRKFEQFATDLKL